MTNFIILIAKYWIFASKYKMQRPSSEGFFEKYYTKEKKQNTILL